jgi:outer membrane lipoprotein LolB
MVFRRTASTALLSLLFTSILIAGCSTPNSRKGISESTIPTPSNAPRAEAVSSWSGRLAYKVEDQPSQSYSGGFNLNGSAQAGRLHVLSPFGTQIAEITWQPGQATLREGGQTREFGSLQALLQAATGTPLPVTALFDWLAGTATQVDGWEADLRLHEQGRYTAKRTATGQATVELRIILDR